MLKAAREGGVAPAIDICRAPVVDVICPVGNLAGRRYVRYRRSKGFPGVARQVEDYIHVKYRSVRLCDYATAEPVARIRKEKLKV